MNTTKKGQAMVEYLILVALIAIGSIAVIQVLSKNLRMRLSKVSDTLAGQSNKRSLEGTMVTEEDYRIKDLGDFDAGIEDSNQD